MRIVLFLAMLSSAAPPQAPKPPQAPVLAKSSCCVCDCGCGDLEPCTCGPAGCPCDCGCPIGGCDCCNVKGEAQWFRDDADPEWWGVYRGKKQVGAFHQPRGLYFPLKKDGSFGKSQKTTKGPPVSPAPLPVFAPPPVAFAPRMQSGGC